MQNKEGIQALMWRAVPVGLAAWKVRGLLELSRIVWADFSLSTVEAMSRDEACHAT